MYNVQGEYRVVIALKWFATESRMLWDDENHTVCHAKNGENHATFVEGFWPEISAIY